MIRTRFTELFGVEHPIALGGMGTGTSAALVSAVANAGGLGILGTSHLSAEGIGAEAAAIRAQTDRPFGINFLLAFTDKERFTAGLAARPAALSFAWPTPEARFPDGYKQAIVASDGTNTLLTDIPDIIAGRVWPGAYNRVQRNRFIETWLGREHLVRQRRVELAAHLRRAWERGDAEYGSLGAGQVAGLIDAIEPAGDLVRGIAADAERIIAERLPRLVQ